MSYKPNEQDIIAYLYGELESPRKEEVERYLLEHPEARAEMERLQRVRSLLGNIEDKEVIAPPIFVGDNQNSLAFWNAPYFKTVVSIAASLIILIMVAKVAGLRVQYQRQELRISFGEVATPVNEQTPQTAALSPDQVQAMINESLNRNNLAMQSSWKETQQKLDESVSKSLAMNSAKIDKLVREASTASQDQVREFVAGIQTENLQLVKNYFKLSADEQKQYIESMLVDFAKYLQQQRNDDLQLVQTRLNSLEKNTNVLKQETEQILTSIITTVGKNNSIGAAN